jgi:putative two-component system response regulator
MFPLNQQPSVRHDGNIMIVDDNPANLTLLEDMLCQRGYDVRSFPRGRLALAAAELAPPELILLDINMPEMDGYEVCRHLKDRPHLAGTPVIFLSALNSIEDKVKGFRAGGIDYISKPFQFEEVEARVATHIQLRRARRTEQELLERTLGGAVQTLWDLVQLTAPTLAARSRAIRDILAWMAKAMNTADSWQCELAANLCLIGCITLPDRVFDMAYAGQKLSPEEDRMFRAHPETGARLLSRIPRLEIVAGMIRLQQNPWAPSAAAEPSRHGAVLLHLAQEFDRRICRGITPLAAFTELRLSCKFEPEMLQALESYHPAQPEFEARRLRTRELAAGMILEQDIFSNGLLILKAGTVLTETWIERLTNFVNASGSSGLIDVRVPRAGVLPKFDPGYSRALHMGN